MREAQLLSALAIALLSLGAHGQGRGCEGGSHPEEMACLGQRLQSLDDELNRVYMLALAAMPEKDESDSRKGREQLRQSQRAWLVYVHEQCAVEGGLQGGSNSWVSTFAGFCEEKQVKSRIDFLKSVANGSYGG